MNIELQMQFDPNNKDQWDIFLGDHAFEHASIAAALQRQFSRTAVDYPLAQMPDMGIWLITHNEVHKSIASIMGLATPPDLSQVDFKNPEHFRDWMFDHQFLHQQLLGILRV